MSQSSGLRPRCDDCLAVLSDDARFCPSCGVAVATRTVPESRRIVTLLFTDVTGSTALGERLDPEAYRGVMTRYFAVAREVVERHGGRVEKFVGDAVLAVFGVPDIREDDALRAVRAAVELSAGVAALGDELEQAYGVRLELRTGVNTGSVVVGASRAGGSFATGDAVNTAARLEQAASPGQILLGDATLDLVRDAVTVAPLEPLVAKGKSEPLVAHRLVAVNAGGRGRVRREGTVLVGRDTEVRVLEDTLERTLETRRSHLVTVLGDPGIGKTRLVDDFVDQVGDRAQVVGGRCVSYGQGITFWPVVQLLREALDLSGAEPEEVTRDVLARLMAGDPGSEPAVDLILPLLGGSGAPGRSDQTSWAVARVLEQLALRRPLVVTVDDLHWAEPTLLELLERVREEVSDLPLLLVCQARPELLDQQPGWGGGSLNSTTMALDPFSAAQTDRAMTALLNGPVPRDVATAVSDWAGGNPLFVEEITAHLVDGGQLVRDPEGRWRLVGELVDARIPPTVAALLAARLDRLPPSERRLLERVSVIGLELHTEEAEHLADRPDAPVAQLLGALARRDLLRRVRGPRGTSWSFKHVLVREAAYESLPKVLRAELHERFADRIQASGTETGPERLAFVAHHLEQAARYRHEVTPQAAGVADLAVRAATALGTAAHHAFDRDDVTAAANLLRRALELPGPPAAQRRDLMVFLHKVMVRRARLGEARKVIADYEATLDHAAPSPLDLAYVRAWDLAHRLWAAEEIDPQVIAGAAQELGELARAAGDRARSLEAMAISAQGSAMLAQRGEILRLAEESAALGSTAEMRAASINVVTSYLLGPWPMSTAGAYAAEQAALPGTSPEWQAWMQVLTAECAAATGAPDAEQLVEQAAATVFELEPDLVAELSSDFAGAYVLLGDPAGAVRWLARAIQRSRDSGGIAFASTDLAWQAALLLETGAPQSEVRPIIAEAATVTSRYDVMSVSLVASVRAVVAARDGDHDAAREYAETAVEVMDRSDYTWQRADVRRRVSEAARRRGDVEEERRLLAEARDLYRSKEIVTWDREIEQRLSELL